MSSQTKKMKFKFPMTYKDLAKISTILEEFNRMKIETYKNNQAVKSLSKYHS